MAITIQELLPALEEQRARQMQEAQALFRSLLPLVTQLRPPQQPPSSAYTNPADMLRAQAAWYEVTKPPQSDPASMLAALAQWLQASLPAPLSPADRQDMLNAARDRFLTSLDTIYGAAGAVDPQSALDIADRELVALIPDPHERARLAGGFVREWFLRNPKARVVVPGTQGGGGQGALPTDRIPEYLLPELFKSVGVLPKDVQAMLAYGAALKLGLVPGLGQIKQAGKAVGGAAVTVGKAAGGAVTKAGKAAGGAVTKAGKAAGGAVTKAGKAAVASLGSLLGKLRGGGAGGQRAVGAVAKVAASQPILALPPPTNQPILALPPPSRRALAEEKLRRAAAGTRGAGVIVTPPPRPIDTAEALKRIGLVPPPPGVYGRKVAQSAAGAVGGTAERAVADLLRIGKIGARGAARILGRIPGPLGIAMTLAPFLPDVIDYLRGRSRTSR